MAVAQEVSELYRRKKTSAPQQLFPPPIHVHCFSYTLSDTQVIWDERPEHEILQNNKTQLHCHTLSSGLILTHLHLKQVSEQPRMAQPPNRRLRPAQPCCWSPLRQQRAAQCRCPSSASSWLGGPPPPQQQGERCGGPEAPGPASPIYIARDIGNCMSKVDHQRVRICSYLQALVATRAPSPAARPPDPAATWVGGVEP